MGYDPMKLTSYFDDTIHVTPALLDRVQPLFENIAREIKDEFGV